MDLRWRERTFLNFCEAKAMQETELSSPAIAIDVPSDGEEVSESYPRKRSHGGIRNTKRFGDKLLALESHNIRYFLAEKRCRCGQDCLLKLYCKGEEGERLVYDLRAKRFQSECLHNLSLIHI